jgi:hypothetical protein
VAAKHGIVGLTKVIALRLDQRRIHVSGTDGVAGDAVFGSFSFQFV